VQWGVPYDTGAFAFAGTVQVFQSEHHRATLKEKLVLDVFLPPTTFEFIVQ
jgi:hypothetical protein